MPAHFFRRFYVERSVGFVGYDVDRGCFMTGAPLWIPAFAGMTKKDQSPRSHRFLSFPQNASRHFRKTLSAIPAKRSRHSCKTLPVISAKHSLPFPQNAPAIPAKRSRHSCKTLSVIPAKRFPSFLQNTLRHSCKTLSVIPAKAGIHWALQ